MTPAQEVALAEARQQLDVILEKVGEDGLADLIVEAAGARLRDALLRLRSSEWWTDTLREAIATPQQYNTQLLCKLLDKAIPTPQSVRIDPEGGFRLVIEHVYPAGKESV